MVAKNGVYLVEDLHTAYWPDHGGGLLRPGSFIETAKGFVDKMHAHYIGEAADRTPTGDRTTSVHFYDSVVVFEVGEPRKMVNKTTGQSERFDRAWVPDGMTTAQFWPVIEEALKDLEKAGPDWASGSVTDREAYIRRLEAEIALLRGSTSWQVTRPVRAVGRILGRRDDG